MTDSLSDDERIGHRMYAPKRIREQPGMFGALQPRVPSPVTSPFRPQVEPEHLADDLDDALPRRPPDSQPSFQPQPRHSDFFWLKLINWIVVAVASTALIVTIGLITKPIWDSWVTQPPAPASRLSDRLEIGNAPVGTATGIATSTRAQQASSKNSVQGVTENEVRFGISAPFSGAAKELGHHIKLGIEAAFKVANTNGGVHSRQIELVAVDDGYEPARTTETMKQLYEQNRVFGMVGNVGTPTAMVALPYALERRMLFYGAFTGAGLLRRDPPDRYVFNYRASYAEETDAVVRYLVKIRRVRPDQIAIFAQQDSYGDSGFAGVAKAIRSLQGGDESTILRLNYKRNTVDVDEAVAQLQRSRIPIKAVIMVPTYRAAARFIEKTRDLFPNMIYTNVSFVGSTALSNELMLLGPKYANGVIVTQVVPAVEGHSSVVLDYKSALAKFFPGEPPDYVSLEGYIAAKILIEALKRNGPQLDTETLVEALENLRELDVGLGTPVTFGRTEHQAVHKVWGTQLDATGRYQPIDLQ